MIETHEYTHFYKSHDENLEKSEKREFKNLDKPRGDDAFEAGPPHFFGLQLIRMLSSDKKNGILLNQYLGISVI